jgi:hypothetical protein
MSPTDIIRRATRLFFDKLGFLSAVTLAVFLPSKLVLAWVCWLFDLAPDGIPAYLIMDFGDLAFSALVIPAAIYGLANNASFAKSMRRGRNIWGTALWNKLKVEITITLWAALLIVPGIVAMMKLILVDPIVALDSDKVTQPLQHSRELTQGIRWRILLTLLPALPLGLLHTYGTLRALQYSRWLMVPVDSVLSILDHWMTAAVVLLYLAVSRRKN